MPSAFPAWKEVCACVCTCVCLCRGQNMSPDLVLPQLEKSVTHMSQLLSSEGPQERKEIEGRWTPAGGFCGPQGHLFLSLAHPSGFWTHQLPVHALCPRHTLVLIWLLTTLLFPACLCLSGLLLATLWGFSLASSKSAGLREMSWIYENQPHIGARCLRENEVVRTKSRNKQGKEGGPAVKGSLLQGLLKSLLSPRILCSFSSQTKHLLMVFVNFHVSLWGQHTSVCWAVSSSLWTRARRMEHRNPGKCELNALQEVEGKCQPWVGTASRHGFTRWVRRQANAQALLLPNYMTCVIRNIVIEIIAMVMINHPGALYWECHTYLLI